jgi:hypothetical protein
MEYQAEKGSDYSSSKRMAQENLDNLKKNCKPSDYEALEKKFNELLAKLEAVEKPEKDREALWAEHEKFMQEFRADLWNYYNTVINTDFATSNSKWLLENAQKANYSGRVAHADSICNVIWKPEDLNKGSIWTNFVWIAKYFWELYPEYLKGKIEPAIQECIRNAIKEKNTGGKLIIGKKWAIAALNYSRAIKLVKRDSYMDGYNLGEKYEKEANVLIEEFKTKIAAKFYTSKFHGENAQKVVFSKKPILIKAENPSDINNEFTAGDNIYAMGYFEIDLASECTPKPEYTLAIYIDREQSYTGAADIGVSYEVNASNGKNTYAFAELIPPFATNNQSQCLIIMQELARRLKPGKHEIMVRIMYSPYNFLAEGRFTLNCSAEGMSKLEQSIKPFEERELEKVRMPKAAQSNPGLETQMKNIWKEIYPDETVLRLVITDKEWTIEKNEITGRIDHRWISAAIAVKRPDGNCYIYWISYKQDYANGKYGELWKYGVGANEKIKCENVNK